MVEEVLHHLDPQSGETIVEACCGYDGHGQHIRAGLTKGTYIGIDWDLKSAGIFNITC